MTSQVCRKVETTMNELTSRDGEPRDPEYAALIDALEDMERAIVAQTKLGRETR